MRLSLGMMFQNFSDWDRFLALERGEGDGSAPKVPDWQAWKDHLDVFLQAEDLGFDALWSVEHHFTPYCLIPDPLQLLTFIAGRTRRIDVGSMVCVLPWWEPLKLAEEVSMLQTVLGDDRNLHIGVGRGLARREYNSLGIDMDESRTRFDEVLKILKLALTNERFSYDGEHFTIPETSIRPSPKDGAALVDRIYGAWGSQPSIRVVAEAGLRPFLNPQKPLGDYDKDLKEFRQVREEEMGLPPVPPTIVLFGYCAETQEQARADAIRYSGEYHQSAMTHYEIGGEHLSKLKTYQQYALPAGTKLTPTRPEDLFYVDQIVGTPDECIRRLEHVKDKYGCAEVIMQVIYGGMPPDVAEKSIQLFGREVVPAVHEMGAAVTVG
jgi:alkanesulfonate monooxygenase SsuD/methylene tetrahydromethanopterin reductase-like flavin-dependent oxidoreductase (luciferase family)